MMETISQEAETILTDAAEYVETKTKLWKLKMVEKIAEIYGVIVSKLIFFYVMAVFVLLLSVGLALWLGELLGKNYYGFFIMGGVFLIAGLILSGVSKGAIEIPSSNTLVKQLLKKKHGKDNES
jgi:hypothetical protein